MIQLGLSTFSSSHIMAARMRHKPLVEEEDASALKLGSGQNLTPKPPPNAHQLIHET